MNYVFAGYRNLLAALAERAPPQIKESVSFCLCKWRTAFHFPDWSAWWPTEVELVFVGLLKLCWVTISWVAATRRSMGIWRHDESWPCATNLLIRFAGVEQKYSAHLLYKLLRPLPRLLYKLLRRALGGPSWYWSFCRIERPEFYYLGLETGRPTQANNFAIKKIWLRICFSAFVCVCSWSYLSKRRVWGFMRISRTSGAFAAFSFPGCWQSAVGGNQRYKSGSNC